MGLSVVVGDEGESAPMFIPRRVCFKPLIAEQINYVKGGGGVVRTEWSPLGMHIDCGVVTILNP